MVAARNVNGLRSVAVLAIELKQKQIPGIDTQAALSNCQ
ncbi:Unknown protein sequence [Pseudomonas syringae pv. syringae]|nr:Unknown protein sequence [Pseudomonas syringae pv. syringae]